MLSKSQIHNAFMRVKTGDKFCMFLAELNKLGVTKWDFHTTDGANIYYGENDYVMEMEPIYEEVDVAESPSLDLLQKVLQEHKDGLTDFHSFCENTASAGVSKWVVDLQEMVIIYFDKNNNMMLAEPITDISHSYD
ncbi:DUF1398 family protein [Limibacter armeniacum]|uniref:DUF1398 domain-containing protein n=1 Tax=Limibacter armeniacum TaxID=466084 RepID=UPI002FE50F96